MSEEGGQEEIRVDEQEQQQWHDYEDRNDQDYAAPQRRPHETPMERLANTLAQMMQAGMELETKCKGRWGSTRTTPFPTKTSIKRRLQP